MLLEANYFLALRLALRLAGFRFAALRLAVFRFAALRLAGFRFAALRLAGFRFAAFRLAGFFFAVIGIETTPFTNSGRTIRATQNTKNMKKLS